MNSTQQPALKQLERLTSCFRDERAVEHRIAWVAAHRAARAAVGKWAKSLRVGVVHTVDADGVVDDGAAQAEAIAELAQTTAAALSMRRHHYDRDNGQKYRFRKLERCGSRVIIAQCKACEGERSAVVEGCGIARLCEGCSLRAAKARRARFGRARARVSEILKLVGYTRKRGRRTAPGGMWSDKMLTLTVPHFLFSHVEEGAEFLSHGVTDALDATMARIFALRAAWPRFARALALWFKRGGTHTKPRKRDVLRQRIEVPLKDGSFIPPPMHRAFEWTPGGDGLGHPHVHVWMIAPFIPATVLTAMWRDALRAVGVPLGPDDHVVVHIKAFRHFDLAAVGELLKGGTRKSLEFSRLYKHGPSNAFEYADGWTIAEALKVARPEVVASLYKALEGARLTQGSRGFFGDDEPPACETCGAAGCWHVRFETLPQEPAQVTATTPKHERGPP